MGHIEKFMGIGVQSVDSDTPVNLKVMIASSAGKK